MTKFCKKANLRVRLFAFAALLSGSPLFAQEGISSFESAINDSTVPPSWIEAATREREKRVGRLLIPAYERELIARIRRKILSNQQAETPEFKDYTLQISRSNTPYDMVAVKGGTFLMGSPPEEEGRHPDEGPQREVTVSDFWMGKFEVTWPFFMPFAVYTKLGGRINSGTPKRFEELKSIVDWVSGPSDPYTDMSFGMGDGEGFPAVCMTQHAANKFCEWLSVQTGHFYRLPTEAEWEYACRAESTGPYSCPENELENFAVLDPMQIRVGYEKVGTKRPNPFGLYDMHGNVMEWCLDAYSPKGYEGLPSIDPLRKPTGRFPRVARGGSWYDTREELRSARRIASDYTWIMQDPQLPQSLWWLTDAQWLGFRVVRCKKIPSEEEMYEIWNCGAIHTK